MSTAHQAAQNGPVGSFFDALAHHLTSPIHGLAQTVEHGIQSAANLTGKNAVTDYINRTVASDDKAIADRESAYQARTPDGAPAYLGATVGEVAPFLASGVANGIRAVGDLAANAASKVIPQTVGKWAPQAVGGAAQGAAIAATQPVTNAPDGYWNAKGDQSLYGAAGGVLAPSAIKGAAAIISPTASAAYRALAGAGVDTTIGQRLGGVWNGMEEKSQSLPIVGDMISRARGRALQSWNAATLNDVVAPVGGQVTTVGHDGVAQAGDILSNAYKDALSRIQGVSFDPQFGQDFGQLRTMAQSLTPDMAARFNNIVSNNFESRLSPAGGMDAVTFKGVVSDINGLARKYAGAQGSEGELGDALTQFGSLMNQQVARANPQLAPQLSAIDSGWAKLVRVEGAAKSAASNKVNTGVFTPSQLMQAVRANDASTRDRATARGQALMQSWAQNGLQVLGDKVPNSGTFDRTANGALVAALVSHPEYAVPVALGIGAGSAAYTPLGQKLAVGAATARPQQAKALADALRKLVPLSSP